MKKMSEKILIEKNETFSALKWAIDNKYRNMSESDQLELLKMFRSFLHSEIHDVLNKRKIASNNLDAEAEIEIREYVKYTIKNLLPLCTRKINEYSAEQQRNSVLPQEKLEMFNEWLNIEDDLMAIASYRSLTHLALYLERSDNLADKVWTYIMNDVMGGIFYYANAMILDNKYQNLIKQCPTGYGKCLQVFSKVLTNKGYKYAKDLEIGEKVYSMQDNKIVLQKITNKWHTRKKQIKLTMRNGINLTISPEHRMFTQRGYVQAKDLTTEDYLYEVCSSLKYGRKINEDELTFITCMIFDGSCTKSNMSFIKQESEILDVFKNACDNLGFTYYERKVKDSNCNVINLHKNNGKVERLLKKYGLYNCYSKDKRLPKQFFNMTLEQRYKFIGLMLATDGYIPKHNKTYEGGNNIGISLANKELIEDIQLLLTTCGIYSCSTKRKTTCNQKEFDAYAITIPDEFIEHIYKNCYCYQKQKSLQERVELIKSMKNNLYCNSINYPKELFIDKKNFKKVVNKQWARNNTFKREIVHRYAKEFEELQDVISNDFVWNKIKEIEYIAEETDMVDIEVENTHNFIANGLVSHNSKSDCVIIAFIFGYDPNATVMKIIGNPSLLGDITEKIVKMLMSERFGKVFPEFGKYEGKKTMFKTLKIADGTFLLKDSKQGISFECSNKESSLDGTRFDYQFYDDITQSKDRENVNAHMKDRDKFTGQWRKRAVSEFTTKRFFTGTAYHREDLLSYVRNLYANDKPIVKDINTINFNWNKWCYIAQDRKTIYVLVKKLADLELGEDKAYVTFPQKFSKGEALKMYHGKLGSIREFWAMEQQQPLPPESLAFDWAYLKQYVTLPENIRKGDCECHAIIDPSRKGYDNFSCLIFKKGIENGEEKWYLTDCFYKKVSSKVAIPEVAERLKFHNVDVIHLENNIDIEETLEHYLLEKLMYNSYTIDSFYSTEKKEDKISMKRDDIKSMLVFPQQGMYSPDSDMGQAMQDIVSYSFTVKNQHDDSIDCCAMFVSQLDQSGQNEIFVLSKNFFLN